MTRHGVRATIAAALWAVAAGCGTDVAHLTSERSRVRDVKVARGDISDRTLLTGQLEAGSALDLIVPMTEAWQLTIRWLAEDGAVVKAGERVLEFDNSQFTTGLEEKRIAASDAADAFHSAREISGLAIDVKEHELQQNKIALDRATVLADVPADLLPQRTVQERLLEKARAEVAVTKAQTELASEKQAAGLDQEVKRIALEKAKRAIDTAEKTIADLVMKAPRDGVMLVLDHPWRGNRFRTGDAVQPGMKIVTFPDLSQPMRVRAELSDVDDGRVAVGAKGTCTLDAYSAEPTPCEVIELAPVAGTPARESLRRAFSVVLSLPNTNAERMRPGMSVKVDLPGPGSRKNVLVVPRDAVVLGDKPTVQLANGDRRDVKLGPCDAQRCAIESGVTEGDLIRAGAL
ncbi:MAG: efflux RND transporter periplasmic adaptor subunit [Kofleriaceae bacterium]